MPAYAYGRRPVDPRRKIPGKPHTGNIPKRKNEWHVLLRDRLPAYITFVTQHEVSHCLASLSQTQQPGEAASEESAAASSPVDEATPVQVCSHCGSDGSLLTADCRNTASFMARAVGQHKRELSRLVRRFTTGRRPPLLGRADGF